MTEDEWLEKVDMLDNLFYDTLTEEYVYFFNNDETTCTIAGRDRCHYAYKITQILNEQLEINNS